MSTRDQLLSKLRAARRPFDDAPPRPHNYLPVTLQDDTSSAALLERFTREVTSLQGAVHVTSGDDAARTAVIDLLAQHKATRVIAWDFEHIPVEGLASAISDANIEIIHPETRDDMRLERLTAAEGAQVSITGADAAAATTGTLIFTTAPGRGRIPTILAPVHIAVITLDQLVTRVEDWIKTLRADDLHTVRERANFCFVSGPSRTGDIEMELILGVHGPGVLHVIVKT